LYRQTCHSDREVLLLRRGISPIPCKAIARCGISPIPCEAVAATRNLSHSVQSDSCDTESIQVLFCILKIYLNLASIHPAKKKRVTQPPIHYCHSDREVLFTSTRNLSHSVQSDSCDTESLSFRASDSEIRNLFK
jgi:hypothetical protein